VDRKRGDRDGCLGAMQVRCEGYLPATGGKSSASSMRKQSVLHMLTVKIYSDCDGSCS
jgi:hypothetical protein